jgi:hypothetical protein
MATAMLDRALLRLEADVRRQRDGGAPILTAGGRAMSLADHECQAIDHGVGCIRLARWYCIPYPFDETIPEEDRGLLVCTEHIVSHGLSHPRSVNPVRWTLIPLEWGS